MALLGFSCVNGGGTANEYGVPSATYKAKGVVVSESDNSPIKGIQAELKRDGTINTVYTNSEGFFYLEGSEFPNQKLYVELNDVDGVLNGSFVKTKI